MEIDDHKQMMLDLAQGYEPDSIDWVDVTHIRNPDSFYVRPTKYKNILMDLEQKVPRKKPRRFQRHQCVVYKCRSFLKPTQYIRGQIVYIDDTQKDDIYCDIFAVDYGYIHYSVPSRRIWKCRDCVLDYPPLAFQCKLSKCSPIDGDEWSKESIETFVSFLSGEKAKMTVVGKTTTKLIVQIINLSADDISTLLCTRGFSSQEDNADEFYRVPPLSPPPLSPPSPPPPSPPPPSPPPPIQLPLPNIREFQCG